MDADADADKANLPRVLPCGHVFHGRCLEPWFAAAPEAICAVCRDPVAAAAPAVEAGSRSEVELSAIDVEVGVPAG